MTTTLYQDKDWKGKRLDVTRNYRSLKDTKLGNHPSSIMMTDADDAILLFGKEDWDGGVMYFRGVRKMASLGDLSAGGEFLKGNSVTSVRVTPFKVRLNVSVVTRNGKMPGGHEDGDHVMTTFTKAMLTANFFFADQKAMLAMEIARTSFRDNPKKFDLTPTSASRFPADWKNPGEIDVVVCNRLEGAYGMAKLPWWGKTVVVALADGDGERRAFGLVARTLAHELGHFLGLGHGSGDGQAANIMTPSDLGLPIDESVLWPEQIEEMQTKLARNLARQGNRIE
jgi:hypothetical protein